VPVGQLITRIEEPGRRIDEVGRAGVLIIRRSDELILAVEEIGERRERLPPQAEIQSQTRRNPEGIAEIKTLVVKAAKFNLTVALSEGTHKFLNVVGLIEGGEASVELENAGGRVWIVLVVPGEHQRPTPRETMPPFDPLPGMRQLDVGAGEFGGLQIRAE